MNKKFLKISFICVAFILALCVNSKVQANSINSIDMDIYVENDGDAQVTETWKCNTTQGTEGYHPYYNLGNSEITDLTVKDNTKLYTTLDSWDVDETFDEKAYKCGINEISNGVEICWGVSKYGTNKYTVKYKISNFVAKLTDSQMMYWTLIPQDFSSSIGNIRIKVHSDKYFEDTIDVWGYGNYGGLCYVNDGAIYMDSDGTLDTSEYMTFLAKFPSDTFSTSNELNNDFNYYYQMAEEGSTKYNKKRGSTIASFFVGILNFILTILPFIIFSLIAVKSANSKSHGFKYGTPGKKIPKDVPYFRDIPCNGDIFKVYYIAYQYGIVKKKTDILGAIILKWLKEGIIRTEQKNSGKVFKKEEILIILGEEADKKFDNELESSLFHMMREASEDGILENNEFEKWCRKSYEKILNWFDKILKTEHDKFVGEGLLIETTKNSIFGDKYEATQELKDIALQIAGLKRFLLDYSLIQERKAIEVKLFEDYLIYAQILGIAKEVSKQFKELYPDFIEQTNYGSYDNLIYINYCASSGISSANSARAAAERYSSGGGGFSSGGGGGGSFGGGGGRRRFSLIEC